ncbi:hypothetical protein MTR_3g062727 [Medicago truncatula]|uniref:Uncharacterized protein n=1 Tax=Medicago truncatula TaxID=3880 RepID=A0A072UY71_MEDTR|nr:hypothetical protein MTR_3g062727 [Medicago truncatula]
MLVHQTRLLPVPTPRPERSQNVLSDLPDLESTVALLAHEITSCDELYNLQPTSDDVMSFCSSDVMLK